MSAHQDLSAAAPIPLADLFAPTRRADWLALVERTIRGEPLSSLESRTADALVVRPLYARDDLSPRAPFDPPVRPTDRPWDVRARVGPPHPVEANAQVLEALGGGAASVLLAIDPAGENGVAVGDGVGLSRALDGVETEIAAMALDAGFLGSQAAGWLSAAAKASPAARLDFHMDPLGAFAAGGVSPGPIDAHIAACAQTGATLAAIHPRARLFLAGGVALHEAGGSEAIELGFAAAAAIAYARALEGAGLDIEEAFARIVVAVSVDAQPLVAIAKLRAARMLWRRLALACGVKAPARIEARSSRRMLTRAEPWTNLVRLTCAAFAAAVGGADSLVLGCFSDALGRPAALARRLARNTQLVVMEEAHLGATADAAGGAFAFEALSADLARAAWTRLQEIEAAGGAAAALRGGLIAAWADDGREALRERIASGAFKILGVNAYPGGETEPPALDTAPASAVAAPDPRLPGPDDRCPPLPPIRLEELVA